MPLEDVVKSLKRPFLSLASDWNIRRHNYDRVEELCEKILGSDPLNEQASFNLALAYCEQQKFDLCIEEIARFSHARRSRAYSKALNRIVRELSDFQIAGQTDIVRAYQQLHKGEIEPALFQFSQALAKNDSIGFRLLFADFQSHLGHHTNAIRNYKKAFEQAFRKGIPETSRTRVGRSRHRVETILHLPDEEFTVIQNFVLKSYEGDDDLAEQELANLVYFSEVMPDGIIDFVRAIIEIDGTKYLVMRRTGTDTLFERPTRNYMSQAIDSLVRIHLHGTVLKNSEGDFDNPADQKTYYTDRLISILSLFLDLDQQTLDAIADNYGFVNRMLQKAEHLLYYKDANPRNFLISDRRVKAIDFETRRLAPFQFDMVTLLEFTERHERYKRPMYEQYKKGVKRLGIDRTRLNYTYPFAALQRHLELIAYFERDYRVTGDGRIKEGQRYHLRKALIYMEKIKSYADVDEQKEIENLKDIFSRLFTD